MVTITSPQAGSTIGGVVTITAAATDEGPVAGVQFQVNGVNLGPEVTLPPYQIDSIPIHCPTGPPISPLRPGTPRGTKQFLPPFA